MTASIGTTHCPAPQFQHLTVDLSSERLNTVKSLFLQSTGQHCSTFDVAGALVWQARTRSLRLAEADPSARVRLCFPANARHLLRRGKDGTAAGFYGNCMYTMTASAESGVVEGADDVARVVAVIREAKARLPGEFARWSAGELPEAEDPYELPFRYETLFLSDWRRMGFLEADYGWGAPSQVIPLAYHPFMPIALIGAPPAPRTGCRIMTRCVEEEHVLAFREEIRKAFDE